MDGLELVQKLHIATGVGIRAPIGYLGNYRFSTVPLTVFELVLIEIYFKFKVNG